MEGTIISIAMLSTLVFSMELSLAEEKHSKTIIEGVAEIFGRLIMTAARPLAGNGPELVNKCS